MSHNKFTNVPAGRAYLNGSKLSAGALALAGLVSMGMGSAQAQSLSPNDTTTSTGTTTSGVTGTTLASPGTFIYGNSFSNGAGSTVDTSVPTNTADGFFDDYIFTVTGTTIDSITSTIDLGTLSVSDLQVALFSFVPGTSTVPLFGNPGDPTDLTNWSKPISGTPDASGTTVVISPTPLAAGTYALEVRGIAGTGGGSYAGVLNLETTPVPLPASLWLMLSGLGGLGVLSRKRRAA